MQENTHYWAAASVILFLLVAAALLWGYNEPSVESMATSTVKSAISSSTLKVVPVKLTCEERTQKINQEALTLKAECTKPSSQCEERASKIYAETADLLKDCGDMKG